MNLIETTVRIAKRAYIGAIIGNVLDNETEAAVGKLQEWGDLAVPALINELKYGFADREKVALALGKIGDRRASKPLSDFIAKETSYFRKPALEALIALGEIDLIRKHFDGLRSCEKTYVAERLDRVPENMDIFAKGFADIDMYLSSECKKAIMEIGEPAVPHLIKDIDSLSFDRFADAIRDISGLEGIVPLLGNKILSSRTLEYMEWKESDPEKFRNYVSRYEETTRERAKAAEKYMKFMDRMRRSRGKLIIPGKKKRN